jgi:hypothetical protein
MGVCSVSISVALSLGGATRITLVCNPTQGKDTGKNRMPRSAINVFRSKLKLAGFYENSFGSVALI